MRRFCYQTWCCEQQLIPLIMNTSRYLNNVTSHLSRSAVTRQLSYRCVQFRRLSSKRTTQTQTSGYNPLDTLRNRKRVQSSITDDVNKFNRLAIATVLCMIITGGIIFSLDPPEKNQSALQDQSIQSESKSTPSWTSWSKFKAETIAGSEEKFQGKPVVVAAGGAKLLAHDEASGEDIELVQTGTSSVPHFPKTIRLPKAGGPNSEEMEYTLIGLGIRTVSFLGIQVYVVGLYVQTSSIAELQSRFIKRVNPLATTLISGEKEELRKALLDPEQSYKVWDDILRDTNTNINTAFRIVPTRGTDFQHLRDGWVRGITNRTQAASSRGDNQFSDESFGSSMRNFTSLFGGKGKAPKGTVVVLTREGNGKLGVLYQDKITNAEQFGTVDDERIARLIWLGYLGGKSVSSEDARKHVVDGIIELVERPIGTVAAKID
jgi:Chalcone isomerase like